MKISEVMKRDDVLINVASSSKTKLLQFLSNKAAGILGINEDDVLAALQGRENLGSTGIGAGIAIPHAPVNGIVSPFTLLVRLGRPVAFEAIDEHPVDLVCLILTPPGEQNRHLKLLSTITRQLRSSEIVKAMRSATDSEHVYEAFIQMNAEL
ncbi:PTS sugar transporter subunit IIA [Stappia sp. TSB10GB4]|uniref:PTS sugar transporter subunit IIA n=1 Tax=Stappia sp. TSB10GB4 TaxID=2003584 RepID=UPI001FCF11E0|nr:PTS sugar transporter subunit IIA [Stappia sp. TSB10GB4]